MHPSRHEGFGLTVLEAMAAGVPVVAVASAGVREVGGDAALLVEPEELADALGRIARDEGAARSPGAGGLRARGGLQLGGVRATPPGGVYAGAPDSGTSADERRHPRNPRDPRLLQRLRDRRRADHQPPDRARPSRWSSTAARTWSIRRSREWKGAELVHLPTVRNKYLDTFVHTLLSSVHAARSVKPDVALFFIAGNSPLCLVTRLAGIPTVINVDGLDSDRRKWNRVAKSYLRAAERLSPRMATGRSPTRTRSPRSTSAATAARSAWCPTAPSCPRTRQRRAGAPRARAAPLRAVRRAAGAGEQPAPAGGGVGADPERASRAA